jgi:hypothetical protein
MIVALKTQLNQPLAAPPLAAIGTSEASGCPPATFSTEGGARRLRNLCQAMALGAYELAHKLLLPIAEATRVASRRCVARGLYFDVAVDSARTTIVATPVRPMRAYPTRPVSLRWSLTRPFLLKRASRHHGPGNCVDNAMLL